MKLCTVLAPLIATLVLAFATVVFGANAHAQEPGPNPSQDAETAKPASEVTVAPEAADSAIAQRLLRILEASNWFTSSAVQVREGIVFLDGRTETDDRKLWAGRLARNTQDVVAVVNRIEVEPELRWDWTPALKETRNLATQAVQLVPLVALAIIILGIALLSARGTAWLARRLLRERVPSPLLLMFVSRAIAFPVFLIGLYLVLQVAGLTRLALTVLGGTGVVGIVLGFAFRDIAENFLASLLLSIRNPFRRGDLIDVDGHHGIVRNMNTRSTILLTLDGNHVRIPNATVFKSTIVNFTSNGERRNEFVVGIGYEDSVAHAQATIKTVLEKNTGVLKKPKPMTLVTELGAATVQLRVYYWLDAERHSILKLHSQVISEVALALTDAGISMPDEAREVIFPKGLPVFNARESGQIPNTDLSPLKPAANDAPGGVAQSRRRSIASRRDVADPDLDVEEALDDEPALEAEEDLLGGPSSSTKVAAR